MNCRRHSPRLGVRGDTTVHETIVSEEQSFRHELPPIVAVEDGQPVDAISVTSRGKERSRSTTR